jgi:hypothetical protein
MFMMRECSALSVRFKDESFKHEQEWRIVAEPQLERRRELVSFRARGNMLVPYIKVLSVAPCGAWCAALADATDARQTFLAWARARHLPVS